LTARPDQAQITTGQRTLPENFHQIQDTTPARASGLIRRIGQRKWGQAAERTGQGGKPHHIDGARAKARIGMKTLACNMRRLTPCPA